MLKPVVVETIPEVAPTGQSQANSLWFEIQ